MDEFLLTFRSFFDKMSSGSSLVASLPSVARKSSSTNTGIEADDKVCFFIQSIDRVFDQLKLFLDSKAGDI